MRSKLGQNFLINKNKIQEIVDILELKVGDVVIEIGPGHGELTEEMDKKFKNLKIEKFKIIAIEKDKELANALKEKFQDNKNIEIIEGDALKLLSQLTYDLPASPKLSAWARRDWQRGERLTTKNFKIIGNIPYYITGFLFRILGELDNKPELIIMMIQKEVAERVAAKPPKNNLLAASVQIWSAVNIVCYVSKKDFDPVPEVDSAVIRLTTDDQRLTTEEKEKYYELIKILFKQPRKTILNNLEESEKRKGESKEEIIKKLGEIGINPSDRPQNLSLEQIVRLLKFFNSSI